MTDIAVFGSLNMDLVVRVPRVPDAGETLQAHSFMTNPGGKGANQAVACARQGARVAMVGRVGEDAFGLALRTSLEADAIETRHVATAPDSTGVALIMVDDSAQNRISLIPGANAFASDEDIARLQDDLRSARLLLLQLEVPMDAVLDAATLAHSKGCTVVLNPAPAQPLPDAMWGLLDMLVLNETEAALLCGFAIDDITSAARAAEALHRRGPPRVILTMGSEGVVACDATGCRHFAALKVNAVDTTAAGDTFIGALCAALARGESMDVGIALGIQAAALCVTRAGAQASIPRRAELLSLAPVDRPTTVAIR
ncbi:ribokinase [Variovorax sp. Sphag1AA]|uniref:ribokinase n=1 Tax=Variovorax sp. Sphag1AA TaxID=2587027 RepID=UPI0016098D09|nr:ribokinase [Variovorax sp. Sphag1AA]MBB3179677.1 ribokinase [Variovorax sp. Sphag1AA]